MKKALIVTAKFVGSAPRVLRELDVLAESKWRVDTVGFGGKPEGASSHFQLRKLGTFERLASYLIPNSRIRFELTLGRRYRSLEGLSLKHYDLVIFHDPTSLPFTIFHQDQTFKPSCRFHVDLHELHLSSLSRTFLEAIVFDRYRRWELSFLDKFVKEKNSKLTISSCSNSISGHYERHWKRTVNTVRNVPPSSSLSPSVPNYPIKLVHHGVGTRDRFHEEYIQALALLQGRFELHFYLLASPRYRQKLQRVALSLGVQDYVFFHDPVPTKEITRAIRNFDVGLVVIPPVTKNEELALPNKLFESIHACLAVVSGPNQDMAELVESNGIGLVLPNWSVTSLTEALGSLEKDELFEMKKHSMQLAERLNDQREKAILRATLGFDPS